MLSNPGTPVASLDMPVAGTLSGIVIVGPPPTGCLNATAPSARDAPGVSQRGERPEFPSPMAMMEPREDNSAPDRLGAPDRVHGRETFGKFFSDQRVWLLLEDESGQVYCRPVSAPPWIRR
jgi:hypothetical protein